MKLGNKSIVAIVGCLTVGIVALLLQNADCLWAL